VIRHIVILQFKKSPIDYDSLLRKTIPLVKQIPGVIQYRIYPNSSQYIPKQIISFGVEIIFKDKDALEVFMNHPNHFEANALFESYLADPAFLALTHEISAEP
jgi:quinol monooxygenase YgiN